MDEQILRWLDSPNTEDRKRAIKKLAQSGDRQALRYLSAIYKTDPDNEVRELAVKAGKYINQQLNAAASTPAVTPPQDKQPSRDYNSNWQGPPPKDDPKPDNQLAYVPVSKSAEERSKGLMESAMEALVARKTSAARDMARKAFALNPNLQHEAYYRGIAGEVMNLPPDQAVEELLGALQKVKNSDKAKNEEKTKRKNDGAGEESSEATWGNALTQLSIYGLVNATIVIVGMVVLLLLLRNTIDQASLSLRLNSEDQMAFATLSSAITSFVSSGGVVVTLTIGAAYGVGAVIGLMTIYIFTHLVAKAMLGGDGTLAGLVSTATSGFSLYVVFTTVFSILSPIIAFAALNQQLSAATSLDQVSQAAQGLETVNNISLFLVVLSLLASVGLLFWYAVKIGQNYQFGTGRGCATIIIQHVLMGVVACGCYFTLLSSLISAMSRSS
ncbi:MAG: HEAT repeat domain-containing protein [Anaerolineae bacterium]|nr:HEAT repeat domain-containing protein [Anaerolineae bacterium]MDW8173691.1 HEAT repeat domain-containing protein [Anaerolineae bacterium]